MKGILSESLAEPAARVLQEALPAERLHLFIAEGRRRGLVPAEWRLAPAGLAAVHQDIGADVLKL